MGTAYKTIVSMVLILSPVLSHTVWAGDVLRLSEPSEQTTDFETFGAPLGAEQQPAKSLAQTIEAGPTQAGTTQWMQTRVAKVCQKKGCFFIAQEGRESVRVSFKDYGFFVPTNISGKTVTLVGVLVEKEVSQAEVEHFEEDLREKPGLTAGSTLEFIASSVRVPL